MVVAEAQDEEQGGAGPNQRVGAAVATQVNMKKDPFKK
jgi:hypothetical protein